MIPPYLRALAERAITERLLRSPLFHQFVRLTGDSWDNARERAYVRLLRATGPYILLSSPTGMFPRSSQEGIMGQRN